MSDLETGQQVLRRVTLGDASGSPIYDFTGTQTFESENPDVVRVTDHGDGTATIAAVGLDGETAIVTYTATPSGGVPVTRVDAVNIVEEGAMRVIFSDDPPQAITD